MEPFLHSKPPGFLHHLYGIRIRSIWPLINVPAAIQTEWDVEFVRGEDDLFEWAKQFIPAGRRNRWQQFARLPDGGALCRLRGVFDFVVSQDARRIAVRCHQPATEESLQAYLLNQALSFSMVRLGREPLHATGVMTNRGVIAFLGQGGWGKSTLAGLMLAAGHRLVTDDMFVMWSEADQFHVHPGPPHIKLYPEVARLIFGSRYAGIPMNPVTQKLIIPLSSDEVESQPRPLQCLYAIEDPARSRRARQPNITNLSRGTAFSTIIGAILNDFYRDTPRLRRIFNFATEVAQTVPVKQISFPRNGAQIGRLRDLILEDLSRLG